MSNTEQCPLCGEPVLSTLYPEHLQKDSFEIQEFILDAIRKNNPAWVVEDGSCPKCWEYFRSLGTYVQ